MGTLSETGKNAAAAAAAALITHLALFDAAGTTEITGGSPAYARQAVTYDTTPSGGVSDIPSSEVFNVPAGATVGYVKGMTALTGGSVIAEDAVTNETYGAQGTYTVTSCPVTIADPA